MEASKHRDRTTVIGLVLIILGGVALLANLGIFTGLGHVAGAILFGVLGALALRHYRQTGTVVALVGAFTLFGLAAATLMGPLSGFFFLALVGVGFGAVYWIDRERWWAIIPAGTLLSLAAVAGLAEVAPRYESGSVLFIGLAATFGLLYRLPDRPKRWAIYPAVAMLGLAVLGLSIGGSWLLPLALVAVGLYLLYRRGNGDRAAEVAAPAGEVPAAAAPPTPGRVEAAPEESGGSAPAAPEAAADPDEGEPPA